MNVARNREWRGRAAELREELRGQTPAGGPCFRKEGRERRGLQPSGDEEEERVERHAHFLRLIRLNVRFYVFCWMYIFLDMYRTKLWLNQALWEKSCWQWQRTSRVEWSECQPCGAHLGDHKSNCQVHTFGEFWLFWQKWLDDVVYLSFLLPFT